MLDHTDVRSSWFTSVRWLTMICKLLFLAILITNLSVGLPLIGEPSLTVVDIGIAPPSGCSGTLLAYPATNDTAQIIIPAFFPFPTQVSADGRKSKSREIANGHYLIPAALLALDEINARPELFPGYHLWLDVRDSSCDEYQSVHELILSTREEQIDPDSTPPRLAVLGGGCSIVSTGLGLLTPRYGLPQVSYGNNPSATDRDGNSHPFFQIIETFNQTLRTTLVVLNHFGWTNNVALIHQDSLIYTPVLETVVTGTFTENFTASILDPDININVVLFHKISNDAEIPSFKGFLGNVRDKNVRVIVAAVNENYAYHLLCEAQSGQIPGSGFVWVFTGSYSERWWNRNTTCTLTTEDIFSVLVVSSEVRILNQSETLDTSGKNFSQFEAEYESRLQNWCPDAEGELLAPTAYDAVWAIALAINSTIDSIDHTDTVLGMQYNYNSSDLYSRITNSLFQTRFVGASGIVQFNDARGRVGIDTIYQIQEGDRRLVGTYDNQQVDFQSGDFSVVWPDGNGPPSDVPEEISESVPLWIIFPAVVITVLGIAFSIAMFVFNWYHRRHRILLAASQKLNYIILGGTWMGFLSVLILCVLESDLGTKINDKLFAFLCVLRLSALAMSFTLAYGTMFARAWRIYRIFNNPWVVKRPLRDYHLMLMVGFFLIGDLIILIAWSAIDYYRRFVTTSEVDYETYSRCHYLSCGSTYLFLWLGVIGMYKILLMIVGVLTVSLVRKAVVERKIFDDSKSLSIALYITAISFTLGLPLQFLFLLQFQVVYAFIAGALWVNVSAYSTIVCVFIPKFYAIVIKKDKGRNLRSLKSVFYVAHPECRHSPQFRRSPVSGYTEYRTSPDFLTSTDILSESVPITDYINCKGSVHALPDNVAKAVSFDDSVDFIS